MTASFTIKLQSVEEFIMTQISSKLCFWYHYLDDIITCIKENETESILNTINNVTNSIKFTLEKEDEGNICFLYLKMIRNANGSLKFKIFRTQTHTDKYLNIDSYLGIQHENSVVRSLMHRANSLCDDQFINNEFSQIDAVLKQNGYPQNIISNISRK